MLSPTFETKIENISPTEGKFILEPLEQGYGHTVGNALRRVLLTSLPGAAITYIKIDGVSHQFSTLSGLKEDIIELILNIKKIRIGYAGDKPIKVILDKNGPGEVTAGDIKTPANVKIINKDLVIAKLADKKAKLGIEFTIEKGYGYSPFEDRESQSLGIIPVDAAFSPVISVNYQIEATRVGRITNYDRLVIEIKTDGTITPKEAFDHSSQILISYFKQIVDPQIKAKEVEVKTDKASSEVLKLSIEELNLPVRISNALDKSGYKTVEDLINSKKDEISKVKNLGLKSIKIVEAALSEKGVMFNG